MPVAARQVRCSSVRSASSLAPRCSTTRAGTIAQSLGIVAAGGLWAHERHRGKGDMLTHTKGCERMTSKRIIIIGGVAGGASAAARARRLSEAAKIILVERGPYVSFANCGLPYVVGGEIAEENKLLVHTPDSLRNRFNLDVRVLTEAVCIDRQAREIELRDLTL